MNEGRTAADVLEALGVRAGATLLVHASLRRVGAGVDSVLGALLDVLGPEGTLIFPAPTPPRLRRTGSTRMG
ncbi:AAC(3) family N-acetyltransferase [Streptomyces sp. NBC_00620]|uniref:AAC(3) family N-acetyltransferase n=1 Tax=Streptomyces sp. NBC_00620 TaxID=2903666 RepID=UPI00225A3926|nr:AAC(3) family N-acetyltransferase [Streptomyces sp. NBC_00620]MCX4973361.1 AAC(3) family N-acetyltransferase [Streptomyces sp. NBC_00620]